jgi:hypothetical protein
MDRIWQWAWDRYAARYSWAVFAISYLAILPTWLFSSFVVVALEESNRYVEAGAVTVVAVLVLAYVVTLPGLGGICLVERWAAGHEVDRARALEATYAFARAAVVRVVAGGAVWAALLFAVVGAITGAGASRLVQYGVLGAVLGAATGLITMHGFGEPAVRPARVALAGDTAIGDSLPRSRPTFAAWSKMSVLAAAFSFAVAGAVLAAVFDPANEVPVLAVVIGVR